jgi:lipopolysaccharide exporter
MDCQAVFGCSTDTSVYPHIIVVVLSAIPSDQPSGHVKALVVRAATGVAWLIAWRMVTRLLGLASMLIMVRLLAPADFGLVALAFSITQGVELLSAFGVEDAMVRHPSPIRATYDTAFTINAIRSAATALLIACSAWPMSVFFREPRLVIVVTSLALATLISGLRNIGAVEFRRELKYSYEFRLGILPRLVSIASSVAFAVEFRSYWAIVVGTLVERLTTTIMTYWLHPHRPRLVTSEWRELTGFSLWVWVTGLIVLVRDRISGFVIGRLLGMQSLGLFSISTEFALLPLTEVIAPLTSVLFAVFSRASHDKSETIRLYLRFLGIALLLMIPAGLGIAVLADTIVRVLLGPQWVAGVPVLRLAALLGPLATLGLISRSLFEARGLMWANVKITLATTILRTGVCLVLARQMGLVGVVLALIFDNGVEQVWYLLLMRRNFGVRLVSVISQAWRPLAGAMVMVGGLTALDLHHHWATGDQRLLITELLVGVLTGAFIFGVTVVLLWWLAGRPDGAETDALTALRRSTAAFALRVGYSTRRQ